MVKRRSRDVMKFRENHPEIVRIEFTVHADVKAQFYRLCEVNRLTPDTANRLTGPELFTRMVQAGLPDREQATNTLPCSTEHLDKLKQLAGCYAVTPEAMLERLIDAGIEERHAIDKRNRIQAPIRDAEKSKIKPSKMADFLLELFDGDRDAARHEYYAVLQQDNPGWTFEPSRKGGDPVATRCHMVFEALRRKAQKAKEKAGTPEEIPA